MNQADLQLLATKRIADAKALIKGKRWEFAFYAAGYAIECGLKSCVLQRMILTGGIFKDRKFAEQCWTHDFGELVKLAGLLEEWNEQIKSNVTFREFWGVVIQWKETTRYEKKSQAQAKDLLNAITDKDGVLPWIKRFW